MSVGNFTVYDRMVALNMINKHVEETITRNFQHLSSSRTAYRMRGNLAVKDSIMESFQNGPYELVTAYPHSDKLGHALFEVCRRNFDYFLRRIEC